MAQVLRSASLQGRNPSGEFLKRRKSWSILEKVPPRQNSVPDVRSFLGGRPFSGEAFPGREAQPRFSWRSTFQAFLATVAVCLLAALIIAAVAICFHSGAIYTSWVQAKGDTYNYVRQINGAQIAVLTATFLGAAFIVVASFVIFSFVMTKLEERKRRKFVSLKEIKTSDVEQGEAYMRTKQSIAKLMSDAERQYVAEYTQRATPSGTSRQVSSGEGGSQDIKVQKLAEGPNQGNLGNSIGLVQGRSWSLKRMWSGSIKRSDIAAGAASPSPAKERPPEIQKDPAVMAARLSSPDAFNRASSSYALAAQDSSGPAHRREDTDPTSPPTPTKGDAGRQRRELEDVLSPVKRTSEPRIMVTYPVEGGPDGSSSDAEEDEFDRERQHSVLPHKAGDPPFKHQLISSSDDEPEMEQQEAPGTAWQDVHLESDDEGGVHSDEERKRRLLAGASHMRHGSSDSREDIQLRPLSVLRGDDVHNLRGYLNIELEEVLPRPQAGLLNRLLRLARVEWLDVPEQGPVFVVQPGKEYMVGLRLKQPEIYSRKLSARWIRIQPPDGQPVRFNVEEENRKNGEWAGSACWDTTLHSSESLTTVPQGEGSIIPVQVTLCCNDMDLPNYQIEAHGTINVILKGSPAIERLRSSREAGQKPSSAQYYLI